MSTPPKHPQIISGILRGERIHIACASTEDATTVTWAAFWGPGAPAATGDCARCGLPLNTVPPTTKE